MAGIRARFQDGSQIVDIIDDPESANVIFNISKFCRAEDEVQLVLDRAIARAMGSMLSRETERW